MQYTSLSIAVISVISLIRYENSADLVKIAEDPVLLGFTLAVGILGYISYALVSKAFHIGPAGKVAHLGNMSILWGFLIDSFYFQQEIAVLSVLGSGMIAYGSYLIVQQSQQK